METKNVQMTAEEAAQFEQFKATQAKKEAAEKAKKDRATYNQMVDDEIDRALPILTQLSGQIKGVKTQVLGNFETILEMKGDVLKLTKNDQKSHTFTNSAGDKRITIGRCVKDGWRDTVEDGIEIVRSSVTELIKDTDTRALVNQIMRLLSRDATGNLKASKVLQLRKMADELRNDRLNEGITIIEESYLPSLSKIYIRTESKNNDGVWQFIPLGMTEA